MTENTPQAATPAGTVTRTPKKAALAAWTGSALEYYDLAIYGTAAALVFPDIFFPEGNESAATVAAFATFGVAYVARPIGSFLMGHIGDKLGRKKVLIGTLLLMGVSTFLVGCLPTYDQVGLLAPVLLVILRLLQGLSAAGEQAGANSMSFEHAPDERRGFFTSFTLSGTQGGQVLAPAVFLPLAAVLPDEQLLTWGWRVPFWLSAIVVLVGFLIRRTLDETPEFQAESVAGEVPRAPLGVLFADHWRGVLRVFLAAFIAMVNTTFQIFALNFATSDDFEIGFDDTFMLWLAIVANLVAIAVIPFWARLSDRVGRKPVFVTGVVGSGILVWGFLGAIAAGNEPLTFVLGVALAGVVYSMPNAVWPATYAEYFPTRVRLSGMAIGTQFGFALAGFTPTIAGAIMGGDADNWVKVAAFASAACAISAIAVLTGPSKTHLVPTPEIGRRPRPAANRSHAVGCRVRRRTRSGSSAPGSAARSPRPCRSRRARASGLSVSYRIIDAEELGLGVDDLPQILTWAERLGYDGLNITHPFKQAVVPLLDELSEDAADLGAVNTVVLPRRPAARPEHRLVGLQPGVPQVLPDAVADRVVLVGAGGAGVAVGYALLAPGRRARRGRRLRRRARRRVRRTTGQAVRRRPGQRRRRPRPWPWPTPAGWSTRRPSG